MGLLNPLLLLLAGAAAVPLLLHLLHRHQGPRVVFPALRYLRRAEKESARRIRLRQLLLMLLRIAAVLLLAFAAARPFVRAGGAGHAPAAVVLVLDNSMSSAAVEGETRVLDELRARAIEALELGTPDDRFWLLRAGRPDEPALAGDAALTARRVRETEPTAAAADLTGALTHARALLASGAEGRAPEIHLLSDLQATNFGASATAREDGPPIVAWSPGTEPPDSRAVADVQVGGGMPPVAGQRSTVTAVITGADGEVNVRLTVEGQLAAAARARPGTAAVLALPPAPPGILTGWVEIDADALHADDRRYFATRITPPPAVAVATVTAAADGSFLDDALDILAEAGRVQRTDVANADIVILRGAEGIAAGSRAAVVVLPPVAPAELAAVNRRLADAGIHWRYGAQTAGEARLSADVSDPLLRTLGDARLRQVYPLQATGAAGADTVLLRLTDGAAWAVRGERPAGGAFVLLGSPLSEAASTLPTTAAMVPLLDRITGAWSMALPPRTDATPGDEVALPAGSAEVERPDGTRDGVAGSASYGLGSEPGIYRIWSADSVLAAYAVNAPAAESDLARLSFDDLETRLPGSTVHASTDPGDWRGATFRERLGRELWRPLLFALLAVLVVEMIVAAAGRTRRAAATAAADSGTL
ncbi:MAG: VWA domain-containing protein [Gemmatimonadota bacterium]